MVVLVVVLVLAVGAGAAAWATRRHGDDVEPTVREFAEFRDAISRQVAGVHTDTGATRSHLDARPLHAAGGPAGAAGHSAGTPPFQG
jgi:hypothetical protein